MADKRDVVTWFNRLKVAGFSQSAYGLWLDEDFGADLSGQITVEYDDNVMEDRARLRRYKNS